MGQGAQATAKCTTQTFFRLLLGISTAVIAFDGWLKKQVKVLGAEQAQILDLMGFEKIVYAPPKILSS